MSTQSLRKDHKLIEKVLQALDATIKLLKDGKQIPEEILSPTLDFTQNFTDVCHHGKEEEALFPALEKAGMPTTMGPIHMMLLDHKRTKEIAEHISNRDGIPFIDPTTIPPLTPPGGTGPTTGPTGNTEEITYRTQT
ncbi:MAG: hemerythrin domain-containing protein, partial [Thermoproteota archaeon]|nr:hemerythrin domain-containing protein [Thermoproteota archaeon]